MSVSRTAIHSVDARVIRVQHLEAGQHLMTLAAPAVAAAATPGSFVHVGWPSTPLAMRRPLSILWNDPQAGTIDVLYKVVGRGTAALARIQEGECLPTLGPIGQGFRMDPRYDRPLVLGGGVGIPPILFLARELRAVAKPFVVAGSEVPFPFATRPSTIRVPGMLDGVIAALSLLEDWGIPSRLCSTQGYVGCHAGYVDALARQWLETQDDEQRARVCVFACGPEPMLEAVGRLAREFELPGQVCMEEYMACAVGGCAGCTRPMREDGRTVMRRVCVDGPVFDVHAAYPEQKACPL